MKKYNLKFSGVSIGGAEQQQPSQLDCILKDVGEKKSNGNSTDNMVP